MQVRDPLGESEKQITKVVHKRHQTQHERAIHLGNRRKQITEVSRKWCTIKVGASEESVRSTQEGKRTTKPKTQRSPNNNTTTNSGNVTRVFVSLSLPSLFLFFLLFSCFFVFFVFSLRALFSFMYIYIFFSLTYTKHVNKVRYGN